MAGHVPAIVCRRLLNWPAWSSGILRLLYLMSPALRVRYRRGRMATCCSIVAAL